MTASNTGNSISVFEPLGFSETIKRFEQEIRDLYISDQVPWVIGYSGGKDSTAILQLVWSAISELEHSQRSKTIHVISTDTLVENPVVAQWVNLSLDSMGEAASQQNMPVLPHRLTPALEDSFWVNLIGKGYPAPRSKFRWCTHRLKIKPSNQFIRNVVRENGEAILVLGTRKAESPTRARTMERYEKHAVAQRLTPNAWLQNSLIYTPIEDWSNDDVWTFLMQVSNYWGHDNKDLLKMYRGASADGECPLVLDPSTPSCGNSRFGCWVCTLVEEDKSMAAMIRNDEEKEWMLPLLKLRNELDFKGEKKRNLDRSRRDFRRLTGKLTSYVSVKGEVQLVHGPYKQEARAYWLSMLLKTQKWIKDNGPEYLHDVELISIAELEEIRRIWVIDKHEIEDLVPSIYEEAMATSYPGKPMNDNTGFSRSSIDLLKQLCGDNELHYELTRNLLDVELQYRSMLSRRGLYKALEEVINQYFYESEEDALKRAKLKREIKLFALKDFER